MFTYIFHQGLDSLQESLSTFVLFFDSCPVSQRLPLLGLCSDSFLDKNIFCFHPENKIIFLTNSLWHWVSLSLSSLVLPVIDSPVLGVIQRREKLLQLWYRVSNVSLSFTSVSSQSHSSMLWTSCRFSSSLSMILARALLVYIRLRWSGWRARM